MKYDFFKGFTDGTIIENLVDKTIQNNSKLESLIILPDTVHISKQKPIKLAQEYIEYGKLCIRSSMMWTC